MQFSSLFIILFGILTFHIVCEAEIPINTNSGSQLESNSSDGSDVEAVDFTEDEIRRVRNTWILATEDSPLDFGEDILLSLDPESIWYLQCMACTLTPERYFNYRMQRNNVQITSIL